MIKHVGARSPEIQLPAPNVHILTANRVAYTAAAPCVDQFTRRRPDSLTPPTTGAARWLASTLAAASTQTAPALGPASFRGAPPQSRSRPCEPAAPEGRGHGSDGSRHDEKVWRELG